MENYIEEPGFNDITRQWDIEVADPRKSPAVQGEGATMSKFAGVNYNVDSTT